MGKNLLKKSANMLMLTTVASMPVAVFADGPSSKDFGMKVEKLLAANAGSLFGFDRPIPASAYGHVARVSDQQAADLIELADGLKARILTREAGNKADMFSFWPNDDEPTHAIFCIEGGADVIGTLPGGYVKLNPSVQSISLEDGEVTTILRGMNRCDGIRTTSWGTVLATEETSSGQAYEIINPLALENQTVLSRTTGYIVDENNMVSTQIVKRDALPTMAWEGLTVLENGVVIAGDELRPGTESDDRDGGAIFKFVPDVPASSQITELGDSPLVAGSVYALQVSCRDSKQQFGQGCEIGNGAWIPVSAEVARSSASDNGATGYYRPEDLHKDPAYQGEGIRFCWTNTGNEGAQNYGEVVCGVDIDPMLADTNIRSVVVNRFIEGDSDFNSVDNIAFQPNTGNLYVIEDHRNGDVFACLPDGEDRDIKSDGCVKMLSVKDQTAEPSGFGFNGDGSMALLSIQHSADSEMPLVDDYKSDDIVIITGFNKRFKKQK